MENIYNLAIVGAGPAGISTSVEAVLLDVEDVILFEKGTNHSETIRKYYKDNKRVDRDWKGIHVELEGHIHFTGGTKESTLNLFEDFIKNEDIIAHFNEEVYSIKKDENGIFEITTNSTEEKTFYSKNVVIAIGTMSKPNKPEYKLPISLKKIINYNILDSPGDEKVLVVGGGDSAVEYAYYIAEYNSVTLTYRKEKITRANPTNKEKLKDYVKKGLIKTNFGVDIESVEDDEGKAKVTFTDGHFEIYDRIIFGLGGSNPVDFLKRCEICLDDKNKIIVNQETLQNKDNIYVAGDIAGKVGGSISLALNHGYTIATQVKSNN